MHVQPLFQKNAGRRQGTGGWAPHVSDVSRIVPPAAALIVPSVGIAPMNGGMACTSCAGAGRYHTEQQRLNMNKHRARRSRQPHRAPSDGTGRALRAHRVHEWVNGMRVPRRSGTLSRRMAAH